MNIGYDFVISAAGFVQLALVGMSIAIPRCLCFRDRLVNLEPLLAQMFWTCTLYITVAHFIFGVVSLWAPKELLGDTRLAGVMTLWMALWWGARLLIHFIYFDRAGMPQTDWNEVWEVFAVMLFTGLTVVYAGAFLLGRGIIS